MKTTAFLAPLVLGLLVAPLVIEAQPRAKIPQVGFLHHSRQADEPQFRRLEEFQHGLRDLGYVEGQSGLGQMTQDTYGKPYLHTFLAFINS